jgi:hypothetical protein
VKLAYGLALSLKLTNKENGLTIIVSDKSHVDPKWEPFFDKIVEIPSGDSTNKFYQRSFFYEASPYKQTVALDADMIFPYSVDNWWDAMSDRPIVMSDAVDFRGSVIKNRQFRKVFDDVQIPDAYSAFFMFDKSKKSKELFKLMNEMFVDWNVWRGLLSTPIASIDKIDHSLLQIASTDVCLGLSLKLLKMNSAFVGWRPKFVHFKPELQAEKPTFDLKPKLLGCRKKTSLTSIVEIGMIRQTVPVHYFEKSWLTDEYITRLEMGCQLLALRSGK